MAAKGRKVKLPVTINVTALDIKRGVREDVDCCAIARACHRAGFRRWQVDGETVGPKGGVFETPQVRYLLPKRAQRFVRKFDGDPKSVKPFTFTIRKAQKRNEYGFFD